jgi:carbonic anhydrase
MLTCSDSRVNSNIIVSDPVNRVFIIKNIGNQIATCEGSLDYAIYHLKTPLLLIVGHTDCGAIKARMKGVRGEPDTIKRELLNLPACPAGKNEFEKQLMQNILENIRYQVRKASSKYQELIQKDELRIVGAYYDFRNDLGQGWGRVVLV